MLYIHNLVWSCTFKKKKRFSSNLKCSKMTKNRPKNQDFGAKYPNFLILGPISDPLYILLKIKKKKFFESPWSLLQNDIKFLNLGQKLKFWWIFKNFNFFHIFSSKILWEGRKKLKFLKVTKISVIDWFSKILN